jgi:hypothetical protein
MKYALKFVVAACLFFGTVSSTALAVPLNFYAVSERGNFYNVSYEAGTGVTSSFIKNLATTSYYYGALDYGPDGSLYTLRGAGGTSTNPGQLYSVGPAPTYTPTLIDLGAGNLLSGMNMGPSSAAGTAAGLAFMPDGTFYAGTGTRFASGQNRRALFLVDPAPAPTSLEFYWDDYTPAFGAPFIQGLQWYNDQLFALTGIGNIDTALHLMTITHGSTNGSVYNSTVFDAGGLGTATYSTPSDLALIESVMFASVGNQLYSYDLSFGPDQAWTLLGDLPESFSGFAALPGQTIPRPVPESDIVILFGVGILGLLLYGSKRNAIEHV